jgi:predicted nucleotidyltransferase
MISNKEIIKSSITRNREKIKLLGVDKLGLFGSYARGDAQDDSDIDILVVFSKKKKNFDNFMDLSFLLEDILEHKVDLITADSLSATLKSNILPEVEYFEV